MKEVYAPDGCYLSVKLDSAAIEKLHLEIDAHAVRRAILKGCPGQTRPAVLRALKDVHVVRADKLRIHPPDALAAGGGGAAAAAAARSAAAAAFSSGGPGVGALLDAMVGYLAYDLVVELALAPLDAARRRRAALAAGDAAGAAGAKRFPASVDWLMVAHHAVGLYLQASYRAADHGLAGCYMAAVYLAEATTPLLHASWALDRLIAASARPRPLLARAFLVNGALGALLFLLLRCVLPPLLLAHLWRHRAAWALYGDGAATASPPLLGASLAGMGVFVLLNWFWFSLMVRLIAKKTKADEKRE